MAASDHKEPYRVFSWVKSNRPFDFFAFREEISELNFVHISEEDLADGKARCIA